MSSQPGPATNDTPPAVRLTKPLRELAALILVGANALLLFVGLIDLTVPAFRDDTFSRRAGDAIFDFVGFPAIALPLLAVVLATHIHPALRQAKTITVAAAVEYAVSGVFAVIALLGWLVGGLVAAEFRALFTGLLVRVAFLSMFAVAAFAVFRIWRTLYYVPRPKPQPGGFGQPQPYGQPGSPQPGGYPQAYGQWPGRPTTYGQPIVPGQETVPAGYQPGYGQPGHPAPAAGPVTGPTAPLMPAPETQVVSGPGGGSEATQVVAAPSMGGSEATQVVAGPGGTTEATQVVSAPGSAAEATQVIAGAGAGTGGAEATRVIRSGGRPATDLPQGSPGDESRSR